MGRLTIAARHLQKRRYALALVLLTLLTGCAGLPSLAPEPPKVRRIGFLGNSAPTANPTRDAFIDGLRDLGYVEGQNLAVEYRFAEGNPDRLPGLARELAELKPEAIFAGGEAPARAVLEVAGEIPIVITT